MNKKLLDELKSEVHSINQIYEHCQQLTDDQLRSLLKEIESKISVADDKDAVIDQYLHQVFAICKDTCRRIAAGGLNVTANDNDRWLAEQFDFVSIEGNKAIYHNHWIAGGTEQTWQMIHYDEQLMGGILLHRGFVAEMATGEGKTLVATLPVMLNALTHDGVHVMTVNDYLSVRDYELTRPIYAFHGLSVGCIVNHKNKKIAYDADITFGTNSEFAFDYLRDHLALSVDLIRQRQHNYAIIDELDSILIDDANTPHIIGGNEFYNEGKLYNDHKSVIEELILNPLLFEIDKLSNTTNFTDEGEKWLRERLGEPLLFSNAKRYEITDFESLSVEEKKVIYQRWNLQNALSQLLRAYLVFERDVDYIVANDKIFIIDHNTGRPKPSSRWEYGLHTAVEAKEGVKVQNDFDSMAVISLKNFFKLYHKLSGMTGTVMNVAQELHDVYGLNSAQVPTHKPCIRIDEPLRIFKTTAEKDSAIVSEIEKLHQQKRPILVGCLTGKRVDDICKLMDERQIEYNRLDAKSLDREAEYIARAGRAGNITISTSIAGRGTDIKLDEVARLQGGLAVIGTDQFSSVRIDKQLRGRSGRQGDPGTSIVFASLEDQILKYLSDSDVKEMLSLNNDNSSQLSAMQSFFTLAQTNCENLYQKARESTVRKDDVIDPYRKKFYRQRNDLLLHPESVQKVLDEILGNEADKQLCDKHLTELYNFYRPIWRRSLWNNRHRQKFDSPFVDDYHIFLISIDICKAVEDVLYFRQEYSRQVVLMAFDKYWLRLVQYLNHNLDSREIQKLPDDFTKMTNEISYVVRNRLQYATIPLSGLREEDVLGVIPNDHRGNTYSQEIKSGQRRTSVASK